MCLARRDPNGDSPGCRPIYSFLQETGAAHLPRAPPPPRRGLQAHHTRLWKVLAAPRPRRETGGSGGGSGEGGLSRPRGPSVPAATWPRTGRRRGSRRRQRLGCRRAHSWEGRPRREAEAGAGDSAGTAMTQGRPRQPTVSQRPAQTRAEAGGGQGPPTPGGQSGGSEDPRTLHVVALSREDSSGTRWRGQPPKVTSCAARAGCVTSPWPVEAAGLSPGPSCWHRAAGVLLTRRSTLKTPCARPLPGRPSAPHGRLASSLPAPLPQPESPSKASRPQPSPPDHIPWPRAGRRWAQGSSGLGPRWSPEGPPRLRSWALCSQAATPGRTGHPATAGPTVLPRGEMRGEEAGRQPVTEGSDLSLMGRRPCPW